MKTGLTLTALAAEIERQQAAKRDLIADTRAIEPVVTNVTGENTGLPALRIGDDVFKINEVAHDQIGSHTGIPAVYYDRLRKEAPELWGKNVREWFRKYPSEQLVRTLDGVNRAFLSNAYKTLENVDFAEAVLPVIQELDLLIMSAQITEKRLYIKAVSRQLERDVPKGHSLGDGSHKFYDTLAPAVILSNSEVGYGQLSIESGIYTKQCTNLASIAGGGWKRRHLGVRNLLGNDQEVRHLLTDETRRAEDRAIWMKARDVMKGAFLEEQFQATVDRLKGLTEQKIEGDVPKVVELVGKKLDIQETERKSVLRFLIEGGDLTRYGLLNAITRSAQDSESYDRASELERAGGDLVNVVDAEWRELAKAE